MFTGKGRVPGRTYARSGRQCRARWRCCRSSTSRGAISWGWISAGSQGTAAFQLASGPDGAVGDQRPWSRRPGQECTRAQCDLPRRNFTCRARARWPGDRTAGCAPPRGKPHSRSSKPPSVRTSSIDRNAGAALDMSRPGPVGPAFAANVIVLRKFLRSCGVNGSRRRLSSAFTSAWKVAAARRLVSVGVTRSARRSPGTGDRH